MLLDGPTGYQQDSRPNSRPLIIWKVEMSGIESLEPVATFCGKCGCGCPQLFVDSSATADRRIVLTDDFGQRVQMSADQFSSLIEEAKAGRLDGVAKA